MYKSICLLFKHHRFNHSFQVARVLGKHRSLMEHFNVFIDCYERAGKSLTNSVTHIMLIYMWDCNLNGYCFAVGFLVGVMTKLNDSKLVKKEEKKCKIEAPSTYQVKQETEAPSTYQVKQETEAPSTYQIKQENEARPQGIKFEEAVSFVEKVKVIL